MSRTMKVSMVVVSLFVIGVCLSLQTTISEEKMDEEITAAVEKFLTAFNSIVTRCITDLRAVLFLGGFFIDDE